MRELGFDLALKDSQQALQLYEDGGLKVGCRSETLSWLVMALVLGSPPSKHYPGLGGSG